MTVYGYARLVTYNAARIKLGQTDKLHLGNPDARRLTVKKSNYARAGDEGMTTRTPGMWANSASVLSE